MNGSLIDLSKKAPPEELTTEVCIMGTPGMVSTLLPFTGVKGMREMTHCNRTAATLCTTPSGSTLQRGRAGW
jgi:hypothetical protein